MYPPETYCRCIPLGVACFTMGIVSLIFYSGMTAASIVLLTLNTPADPRMLLKISVSVGAVRIVLCVILATSMMAAAASISLVIGMRKKRPGLVLFYFGYCVFLAILYMLGAILLFIEKHWIMALSLSGVSLILIHLLVVVVHAVYEGLQRGQVFDFGPHARLDEGCDDPTADTVE